MRKIVVLIVCVSVSGCSQPEVGKPALAERPIPADLVVRGGPVITMDTGLLRENAQRLVARAIAVYQSRLSAAEVEQIQRDRVQRVGQEALKYGVTSFHDAGSSFAEIDFFR